MEIAYMYTKARSEFGKQVTFDDENARVVNRIKSGTDKEKNIPMNPCIASFDTNPEMSIHTVNTDRLVMASTPMLHKEGGWPRDVDCSEPSETSRYRKKAEKDEAFRSAIGTMAEPIATAMKQNNTINIYEEYFTNDETDYGGEVPMAKGLALFRDPNAIKRTAAAIDWHPSGPSKIAVSYTVLRFQDPRLSNAHLPKQSYIWDIMNPSTPNRELAPPSPMGCIKYNPKQPDIVLGGCLNGLVAVFDLRKQGGAGDTSEIEHSHHDPVSEVFWVSSKSGNSCASVSTDGRLLWWDVRKISQPTDQLVLKSDSKEGGILGGSAMDYNHEAGATKYLVGTEQGVVSLVNLRNRRTNGGVQLFDTSPKATHHGPIYSLQRNPVHYKFFLTVGDWTARIWTEDLKSPILSTKYHDNSLTGGCWSPTRPGVFFTTRSDGVLDVWDLFWRQSDAALSHKVGSHELSSLAVASTGRLVAVGDVQGNVSLIEVSEGLAQQQGGERLAVGNMLDREMRHEKMLEHREKESRRLKSLESTEKEGSGGNGKSSADNAHATLKKVDADFIAMIKSFEDDESKHN